MLRRYVPLQHSHLYLSDSETESDDLSELLNVDQRQKGNTKGIYVGKGRYKIKRNKKNNIINGKNRSQGFEALEEDSEIVIRKVAEKYQQQMKQIQIPEVEEMSPISFITWQGLGKSMKQKYGQPLHYLTQKLLKEWDQWRSMGSKEETQAALKEIIDPQKAQVTIWVVEQFHRQCSPPHYLAKLWLSDPMYQDFLHPIIP